MADQHKQPDHLHDTDVENHNVEQMDTADKSLSDALRISFAILKLIMMIVVIAFLASGFQTIGPDEQGLKLRFGKIQTVDQQGGAVLEPGLRWMFPYPIDELVKIPVEKRINLPVNSFWYNLTPQDILGRGPRERPPGPNLDPTQEGYCLTRGERLADMSDNAGAMKGNDYNIVHSRWQVTYKIKDIRKFYQNVFVREAKPGDVYGDLMAQDVKPLLQNCFEDAVVNAMVHYTIDEALESKESIRYHVQSQVQAKLDGIDSGMQVVSVTLDQITWPRQVNDAFNACITASQDAETKKRQAETDAQSMLNKTAGRVARTLATALQNENTAEEEKEQLWSQVTGEAGERIADAVAYRTEVVESARAAADYFQRLLPKYRERPELFVQNLYVEAVQEALKNIGEKFLMQYSDIEKRRELRILLNRIPRARQSSGQDQTPQR